jgi:hypothetical protein
LVRTEGARLGLAHAPASEPHAAPALADERLSGQRRRSQDHSSARELERRRTEDHREAFDGPPQDDREAQHGQAEHREAKDREEEDHGEAWRAQDDGSPQERRPLDGEAHDTPYLDDAQEAPLNQVEA